MKSIRWAWAALAGGATLAGAATSAESNPVTTELLAEVCVHADSPTALLALPCIMYVSGLVEGLQSYSTITGSPPAVCADDMKVLEVVAAVLPNLQAAPPGTSASSVITAALRERFACP